jgi:hypothetical protein
MIQIFFLKSTYFGMIQIYDYFKRWNIQFGKIFTLWKFYIYSKWLTKKCDILRQLFIFWITSSKRFHSKFLLYEKMKMTKKGLTILTIK